MAKILGICGCMQPATTSRTWQALCIALTGAQSAGAAIESICLHTIRLPLFDALMDAADYPPDVAMLLSKVRAADALILASPVYHGTISGAMKNCLDFFQLLADDDPPYLTDRILGLICVSGGAVNTAALDPFYHIARALYAWVLPLAVAVPGNAFDDYGRLAEPQIRGRLTTLGRRLTEAITRLGVGSAGLQPISL